VHVPLIIRVPWKEGAIGARTTIKAELIDLYRTLADLTGVGQDDVGDLVTLCQPLSDDAAIDRARRARHLVGSCV
jgi:arylsulfatase A-like enzyme